MFKTLFIIGFFSITNAFNAIFYPVPSPGEIQLQADVSREKGESLKAINLYNQSIIRYQEEHNYSDMLYALNGRLICWGHLYTATKDKTYAIFAKADADAMRAIAEEHKIDARLHLVDFVSGKTANLLQDYAAAEEAFSRAVASYPFENGEKGDWMVHLGEAMYKNGKKEEGKSMILEGLQRIQAHYEETGFFRSDVWISGAYLKLAHLLREDDPQESQLFFHLAKEVVGNNSHLTVRKQQIEAIEKELADG